MLPAVLRQLSADAPDPSAVRDLSAFLVGAGAARVSRTVLDVPT